MKKKIVKGRYLLHEKISEDTLCYTYLGIDQKSSSKLFITQYKAEYLIAKLARNLINTMEVLIKISHQYLLPILDYDYDGGDFYVFYHFTEDLIALEAVLIKRPSWGVIHRDKVAIQLIKVLIALSEEGEYFGNLSLAHIYLTPKGDVKLINMRLPALILQAQLDHDHVWEDSIFYAPEFLHDGCLSQASDIYGLGILLYFLYTDTWPYQKSPSLIAMKESLLTSMQDRHLANSNISPERVAVITHTLEKEAIFRGPDLKTILAVWEKRIPYVSPGIQKVRFSKGVSIKEKLLKDIACVKKIEGRPLRRWLWICSVLFAIGFSGYALYFNYLTEIPMTRVPSLIGLTVEEASQELKKHKLILKISGYRGHPIISKGVVIESKPPESRSVKQNRSVRVFISKGPHDILVPLLLGRSLDESKWVINKSGLRLGVQEEQYSLKYPAGVVVEQYPTANSLTSESTTLNVTLSKGYPLDIEYSPKTGFFAKKDEWDIKFDVHVLLDWPPQTVHVQAVSEQSSRTLLLEDILPGEQGKYMFLGYTGESLEVYFNGKLGYKKIL